MLCFGLLFSSSSQWWTPMAKWATCVFTFDAYASIAKGRVDFRLGYLRCRVSNLNGWKGEVAGMRKKKFDRFLLLFLPWKFRFLVSWFAIYHLSKSVKKKEENWDCISGHAWILGSCLNSECVVPNGKFHSKATTTEDNWNLKTEKSTCTVKR